MVVIWRMDAEAWARWTDLKAVGSEHIYIYIYFTATTKT
jgi:hypothetical protein